MLVCKGAEQCLILTDEARMNKAYNEISILLGMGTDGTVSPENTGKETYTITFFCVDGTQAAFTLDGTNLCDVTTGKQQMLTEQQLANLKQMLDLPG